MGFYDRSQDRISDEELRVGIGNYHKMAENYRADCAGKRAREADFKNEQAQTEKALAAAQEAKAPPVTAPAEVKSAAPPEIVHKGGGDGAGLVYKRKDDARRVEIADDGDVGDFENLDSPYPNPPPPLAGRPELPGSSS